MNGLALRWLGGWLLALTMLVNAAAALDNPEQKVTALIKDFVVAKYPAWTSDEVRVTCKGAETSFTEMKAYGEAARLTILEVMPDFKPVGSVIFPLQISDGENSEKFLVRAKVEVRRKIVAAATTIKKGKRLEAADLKLEERDVALLPDKYFVETYSLASKEARITIPENSTLFSWMVGAPPLFHRGATVALVIDQPALTVKVKGEALDDGYPDLECRVKRGDNNKIVKGTPISADEVEVKI